MKTVLLIVLVHLTHFTVSQELHLKKPMSVSAVKTVGSNTAYIYNIETLKYNDLNLTEKSTLRGVQTIISALAEHRVQVDKQKMKTDITQMNTVIQQQAVLLSKINNVVKQQQTEINQLKETIIQMNNSKNIVAQLSPGPISRDCAEVYQNGATAPGVYDIQPLNFSQPFKAYCKNTWTYIHHKTHGSALNFHKDWNSYKNGFGNLDGDFWLGNEKIHALTKQGKHSLYIGITTLQGRQQFSLYKSFKIGAENSNYKLIVSEYDKSSSAEDNLQYGQAGGDYYHGNRAFSTKDKDNDGWVEGSCANTNNGGWWYANCLVADLTGQLYWYDDGSIQSAFMKIQKT